MKGTFQTVEQLDREFRQDVFQMKGKGGSQFLKNFVQVSVPTCLTLTLEVLYFSYVGLRGDESKRILVGDEWTMRETQTPFGVLYNLWK